MIPDLNLTDLYNPQHITSALIKDRNNSVRLVLNENQGFQAYYNHKPRFNFAIRVMGKDERWSSYESTGVESQNNYLYISLIKET